MELSIGCILAQKVSLLVFSRDEVDKTISLIDDMYKYVDEIVLVDSSKKSVHDRLLMHKKNRKLGKLSILYVIAFGYPDPFRMYALKKCRNDWVLLVDTDERLSEDFKKDLHSIINTERSSAFGLKRYEEVGTGAKGAYFNWQIRLFIKSRTEFRGLIHEEPIIKGNVGRLEDHRYFIDHINELRSGTHREYSKTEKFMRMSYGMFNDTMLEYLYKFTLPKNRNSKSSGFGKLARSLLSGYGKLKGKKENEELSDFDYAAFFALRTLTTSVKERRPSGLLQIAPEARKLTGKIREWKSESDSSEVFEISKILHRIGLIKFLELDNDSTVEFLNKKYRNKKQGVGLLMDLIKEKYEKDYK